MRPINLVELNRAGWRRAFLLNGQCKFQPPLLATPRGNALIFAGTLAILAPSDEGTLALRGACGPPSFARVLG